MKEDFNEYMDFFKNLSLKEKQEIILDQLKMIASFSNQMCTEYEIPNELIMNRELLDMNSEDYTQDDFAEAVIVYVNSIQNSLSDFSIGISDKYDKEEMLND